MANLLMLKSWGSLGVVSDQILWDFSGSISFDISKIWVEVPGMVLKLNFILWITEYLMIKKYSQTFLIIFVIRHSIGSVVPQMRKLPSGGKHQINPPTARFLYSLPKK